MTDKPESGLTVSARQFQTVMMAVALAALAWVGNTLNQLNITVATMEETVATMKEQDRIDDTNKYTVSDAEKDFRLRDEAIGAIVARINRLEADENARLRR